MGDGLVDLMEDGLFNGEVLEDCFDDEEAVGEGACGHAVCGGESIGEDVGCFGWCHSFFGQRRVVGILGLFVFLVGFITLWVG